MKIIKTELLQTTDWVHLKERIYLDGAGNVHHWDYVERIKNRQAVVIVPIDPVRKKIVLIKQYRVVLDQYVIEFPAGLIDEGETIEQTAYRELAEETGLEGKLLAVGPPICTSPGLTNELIYMTEVAVDLTAARVADCRNRQQLEQTEEIEVLVIDLANFLARLQEWIGRGWIIDCRVWSYGLALKA